MDYAGEPMVPMTLDGTIRSVLERIGDSEERCLLAIRDERAPLGWWFVWWDARS